MSTPTSRQASDTPSEAPRAVSLERIGPYRLIRVLGEGGMGIVYLAEQEEPVRREVAVKILRGGYNSAAVVARFATERQALALMEHPNITRVFDAGLTPAGLPYFVMERVEGIPITEYAAEHRLTTAERAALFVQVCRAVQHAHQKGVIHRDIKPSNVLVMRTDGLPICKVIDFGIAKATGSADLGARLTATGAAIGTPAYMSPEQFLGQGDDVDTRSDIYSLGILLYELLAGALPGSSGEGPSWAGLMRRFEGDLPSASAQFAALSPATRVRYAAERRTNPEALRRSLRGDLDSILCKALDMDRERRYATAAAFADDLDRYLANQPISARGTSRAYRAQKFVQRHRAGVLMAGLLLVVLMATAIGASIQARRLAAARMVAVSRQHAAEELVSFMIGDLSTKLRPLGRLDVLDDVDRKALSFFAGIPVATMSDEEQYRRAHALWQLGDIRLEKGRYADADSLMHQSLALSAALVRDDTSRVDWQLQLALSQYGVGSVAWQQGRIDDAMRFFVPFARLSERLVARYPDSLDYRAQRAYALNNIGAVTERKGDAAGALRAYVAARDLLQPLVAGMPGNVTWQTALGNVLNAAGEAQRKLGDIDGALASHQQELDVRRRLLEADSSDSERIRVVATARAYLGDTYFWRGNTGRALVELREARRLYASLMARDSGNPTLRLNRAVASRRIAQVQLEHGDAGTALASSAESRADFARLPVTVASSDRARRELVNLDVLTARGLLLGGRRDEAYKAAQRGTHSADSTLTIHPDNLDWRKSTIDSYLVLGDTRQVVGDSIGAAAAWSHALALSSVAQPLAGETDFMLAHAEAALRLGQVSDGARDVSELVRRGVRKPSFLALVRDHGLPVRP